MKNYIICIIYNLIINYKMNLISLGRNCCVAYNIRNYLKNKNHPTHFFDWIRSDFKSVLYILNLKTIDTIFNLENLIVDKETWKKDGNVGITLKNVEKDGLTLLFHHDILFNENDNNDILNNKLKEFIVKYKRRHYRLINLIKTSEKKYFVYHNNINENFDYDGCVEFNRIIKNINKNINYVLVLLMNDVYNEKDYKYIKTEYYFKINLKHFMVRNNNVDWTLGNYNWKDIFDLIKSKS
jgi:hypothetical protein